MKFKHLETKTLINSAKVIEGTQIEIQANIHFEILSEIEGHIIPDNHKYLTLTYFGLVFDSPNDLLNTELIQAKGLAKLKEVYGNANIE